MISLSIQSIDIERIFSNGVFFTDMYCLIALKEDVGSANRGYCDMIRVLSGGISGYGDVSFA